MMPEMFQYDFMVRAFLAGMAIAVVAPLIGTFLVVRRYSLMADALAHVALAGVAIGLLFNLSPVLTATLIALLSAIGIEKLRNKSIIYGESTLALVLSGGMAVAVVLISLAHGFNIELFSFLFGSVTTVTQADVGVILGLSAVVLLVMIAIYKELFAVSFDEEVSQASGIDTKRLNTVFVAFAALTIAISMRIVGILLIGALMVIPVLTGLQLGRSFKQTILWAILFSLLSVVVGMTLSFYFDLASGGTIVLVALLMFLLSFLLK